jgi:hypothetical protein
MREEKSRASSAARASATQWAAKREAVSEAEGRGIASGGEVLREHSAKVLVKVGWALSDEDPTVAP